MTRALIQWLGVAAWLAFGFWAGPDRPDPVIRQDFTLLTPGRGSFDCVAMRPRSVNAWSDPVVIYAHAAGGSLSNDIPALRQLAELGLAAVSLDYDQTNHTAFHAQFDSVQAWLSQKEQSWANPRAVAWLGLSLGANHFMDEALRHDQPEPQLLILLSGQGLTGSFNRRQLAPFQSPVLLLQGEEDEVFPWTNTAALFEKLTDEGVPVGIKVFPGLVHALEPERGVILRCLGEYCLTQLAGDNWWRSCHFPAQPPVGPTQWFWWLPAVLWWLGWKCWWRGTGARPSKPQHAAGQVLAEPVLIMEQPATICGSPACAPILRLFATVLVVWVLSVIFVYMITPHLPMGKFTLAIAQRWMVPPAEKADFDYLRRQPAWAGAPLKNCIEQIQLAGFVRRHFELRGDDALYRDYCLSPFITGQPGESSAWRRALWTEFDPIAAAETNPVTAASLVVRHLREQVTVLKPVPGLPEDASGIWQQRVTDVNGFETTYVAALRSIGIPARLDAHHLAELWNGTRWQTAPAPALMVW